MRSLLLSGLLIAVAAVWGLTFVVVRDAVAIYPVLGFLSVRFAIAAASLGPFSIRRLTRRTLMIGSGIGASLAVGYLLQTIGLRYTTPTNSGLITGLFVVFAPMANRLLFGVRMDRVFLIPLAVSLVGMILLTGQSPEKFRVGDALTLGTAAAFGLHIALLSRYANDHDAIPLACAQMTSMACVFGATWLFFEPFRLPSTGIWFALGLTGVVASAAAFSIQTFAQQHLSAIRTAIILMMEPVFATFFGYILAGDRLTPIQVVGALLILAALVLGEVAPRLKSRET